MLSEKGLLIIEKLAEHNNELVTSKALAASTGMSERSVKTYLKEVADFVSKFHGARQKAGQRHEAVL